MENILSIWTTVKQTVLKALEGAGCTETILPSPFSLANLRNDCMLAGIDDK